MSRRKLRNKETNRHHVIPKSAGGRGLKNNTMRLLIYIHCLVHYLDSLVDKKLVKKDHYYYLIIIGAAYKCRRDR